MGTRCPFVQGLREWHFVPFEVQSSVVSSDVVRCNHIFSLGVAIRHHSARNVNEVAPKQEREDVPHARAVPPMQFQPRQIERLREMIGTRYFHEAMTDSEFSSVKEGVGVIERSGDAGWRARVVKLGV